MPKKPKQDDSLSSNQAQDELGVSACDLSHLREEGKLRYRKEGNAFRYMKSDVVKLSKKKPEK